MSFIITGTDTHVGKTLIASWLCLHTGFDYWKPLQTGEESDSLFVKNTARVKTHPEAYRFQAPLAPLLAAQKEGQEISLNSIRLPTSSPLIVEGAGGVFVPIAKDLFMIDLFKKLNLPVIVVSRTTLGTINHTILTLEALRSKKVPIQGVILNGEQNPLNRNAIEQCGNVPVIAEFPQLSEISYTTLCSIKLPQGVLP